MKKAMMLTAILFAGAAAYPGSLVVVESDARSPEAAEFFLTAVPVHVSPDWFVALCPGIVEETPRMTVIDSGDIDLDDYVLVHLSSDEGLLRLADLGETLFDRDGVAVVRLDGPFVDFMPRPGVFMIQPLREQRPPSPYEAMLTDRGRDDYVADMVAMVSEDSLKYYIQNLQDYMTRHSSTDGYDTASQWVEDKLDSYGLNAFQQTFPMSSYNCQNVVGELVGNTYPDQYWIVCGHLDSTSPTPYTDAPGADDNGSGSSTVVEAARILSQYEFRYSIRFICFGGEEQGLWGSAYYASQAASAGDDILGAYNLDMILYGPPPDDVLWVSYNGQSTGFGLAIEAITDTYVPALQTNVEYNPGLTASDHASFWNNGYAAVLGIEEDVYSNPYYHQTTDVLANYLAYFPFGTDCARSAVASIAYLAQPTGPVGTGEGQSSGIADGRMVLAPNPAASSVTISLPGSGAAQMHVSLYDLSGRLAAGGVMQSPDGSAVLDVSSLPPGVYQVMVRSGSLVSASRLVILD